MQVVDRINGFGDYNDGLDSFLGICFTPECKARKIERQRARQEVKLTRAQEGTGFFNQLGGAIGNIAGAFLGVGGGGQATDQAPAEPIPDTDEGSNTGMIIGIVVAVVAVGIVLYFTLKK